MTAADVSIVVPAYRAEATLARCVDALLEQEFGGEWEIVLIASGVEANVPLGLPEHARLRVHRSQPRLSAAVARNIGVELSSGALIAFTDADVVAPPEWLHNLISASEGGSLAVAGSVVNGTPFSRAGTVEYLVEFLDCHPERPADTAWHGATCNLLVPRVLWHRFGPFPEDLDGGEDTLLTIALRQAGLFTFAGQASITHLNRTRFADVVRHQYQFGKFTAHIGRRTSGYRFGWLVRHTLAAPIAAAGRALSIYGRVIAWDRRNFARALRLSPGVGAVLMAWGAGLFVEGVRISAQRVRPAARSAGNN
jgi:glycosyltransferase involved in cell wall biosynthesis